MPTNAASDSCIEQAWSIILHGVKEANGIPVR